MRTASEIEVVQVAGQVPGNEGMLPVAACCRLLPVSG
jgi:hypothetical protein